VTIKGEMNIDLHEWLKILPYPVTSIDITELMENSKEFPFNILILQHLNQQSFRGRFGMASGETRNISR